jgi:hypothetical protein
MSCLEHSKVGSKGRSFTLMVVSSSSSSSFSSFLDCLFLRLESQLR